MKTLSAKYLLRFLSFVLPLTTIILIPATDAVSAIKCYECHGTVIDSFSGDYRPWDANSRDAATGGFQGNHQTHMGQTTDAAVCAKCHPGSESYPVSHRDGHIKVSSSLNNSPLITKYNNTTTAWHQTVTPALGTCTNANCHFETVTPVWAIPLPGPEIRRFGLGLGCKQLRLTWQRLV